MQGKVEKVDVDITLFQHSDEEEVVYVGRRRDGAEYARKNFSKNARWGLIIISYVS